MWTDLCCPPLLLLSCKVRNKNFVDIKKTKQKALNKTSSKVLPGEYPSEEEISFFFSSLHLTHAHSHLG